MESIKIGEYIYSILSKDERLKAIIGNKIYPIVVEQGTTFPFVVYRRTGLNSVFTKDLLTGDVVSIEFMCVSTTYKESLDIVSRIRDILEGLTDRNKGVSFVSIDDCSEDYSDDAFIQIINITFKTIK